MEKKGKVSIIMPVYNEEEFVIEALKSVFNQSYKNWELIVINDGSTDNTLKNIYSFLEKKQELEVKIISFSYNRGKVSAINEGFKSSQGDFICFLAGDDVLHPKSLEKRVGKICTTNFDAVYHNGYKCDRDLRPYQLIYPKNKRDLTWEKDKYKSIYRTLVGGGLIMITRNIAEKIFPIPEQLEYEDRWIAFWSLFYGGKIAYIDEPLLFYRIHGLNDSSVSLYKPSDSNKSFIYSKKRSLTFYKSLFSKILVECEKYKSSHECEKLLEWINMCEKIVRNMLEGKITFPNYRLLKELGFSEILKINFATYNLLDKAVIVKQFLKNSIGIVKFVQNRFLNLRNKNSCS